MTSLVDSIQVVNEPPLVEVAERLLPGNAVNVRQMLDRPGVLYACAYYQDELIGMTWAVGDGTSWLVPGTYVHPDFRKGGVGGAIRASLIMECQRNTQGSGFMYGFYGETHFWDKIPGTENLRGFTGRRIIAGTAREKEEGNE